MYRGKKLKSQGAGQQERGVTDRGRRSVVTGGKQLDGFIQVTANTMMNHGVKKSEIYTQGHDPYLPGYYRPHKKWDLLVIRDRRLLAAVEFKSMASSFGNNLNNRSEEAIGSAQDLLTAYREDLLGPTQDPWLGYLLLMKDSAKVHAKKRYFGHHYESDPAFNESNFTYAKRAEILIRRLVRERKYNAGCLLLSSGRDLEQTPNYQAPAEDLSPHSFLEGLLRKVVP